MSNNLENSYIRKIDTRNLPSQKTSEGLARSAEKIVIDCLNENLKSIGMGVRPASLSEDSGIKNEGGKQIDAVLDIDGKAKMCMQITTARNSDVQRKKLIQLKENPFVRLEKMNLQEIPIPKVLININPEEVTSFLNDPYFSHHPKIWAKIKNDITNSLLYVLNITKNDKEKAKTRELLALLADNTSTSH